MINTCLDFLASSKTFFFIIFASLKSLFNAQFYPEYKEYIQTTYTSQIEKDIVKDTLNIGVLSTCLGFILHYRHLRYRRFKHMFGLFFCIIKIILNIGVLNTCLGFILHYRHLRYSRFKHMFALFRIINGICKSLMILLMVCY